MASRAELLNKSNNAVDTAHDTCNTFQNYIYDL